MIVARPKSPDGRSVTHAVKLSEAESAAADVVRGDVRWSVWLRGLVLAAVEPGRVVPSPRAEPVNRNEPVNLNPDAVNLNGAGIPVNQNVAVNQNKPKRARAPKVPPVAVAAGLVPASALPKPQRCTHPGTRIIGGYCESCDHRILSGGIWA